MIFNASGISVKLASGGLPNVNGALNGWRLPMTFGVVTKEIVNAQVVEVMTAVNFKGVIQPLSARRLEMKPEGQRAWTWLMLHADPTLALDVDDVVTYNGTQTRVMARKNYTEYGYIEYELVQDYVNAGPAVEEE